MAPIPPSLLSAYRGAPDPRVRAAVLVRQGRLLRKSSRWQDSDSSYRQLAGLGRVDTGGIPAVLAAHAGSLKTWTQAGDSAAADRSARQLLDELLKGAHPISAETFTLLTEDAFRRLPELLERARPQIALAEASQALGDRLNDPKLDGGSFLATRSGTVLVIVQRTSIGLVAYLAAEKAVQTEWLALVQPSLDRFRLSIALAASDGRVVAGVPPKSGHSVRLAQATQLPWTVMVFPSGAAVGGDPRRALLAGGLAVLFLAVAAAMWLSTRAVFRELELARLKAEFAATVSHEFRTPLTAIRQLSELLVTDRVASDEDRREYYRLLAAQGERLHRLVEGLLNFGRIEAGKLKLRIERIHAAALAGREAADFERQPAACGYKIACTSAGPAIVEADPDALRLSLANLLENAVKYSPGADSVSVQVTTANGRVEIAVTDRGPGIDPAERDRIFEKFVRGKAGAAGHVPGTGIGLAMARELMRAHGGDIELTSRPGEGSTFTLVLPRAS